MSRDDMSAPTTSEELRLHRPGVPDQSDALFAEYQERHDPAVREQLIMLHMNLVRFLARKYSGRGEPLDDLIQVGVIGLMNAIDRFDTTRGIRFATYATPTIVGEIRRYFRDRGWAVKVPRRLQETNLAASRAMDSLTQKLGRAPTIKEIAAAIDASEEETMEAMELGSIYEPSSLEQEVDSEHDDSHSVLGDYVGKEDEAIAAMESNDRIQDALSRLSPRERAIIELRFFENLSQIEVAKRLRISQMHVSRIQQRALAKLREVVRELDR
jgi:RNA polymerase sigma-B factor